MYKTKSTRTSTSTRSVSYAMVSQSVLLVHTSNKYEYRTVDDITTIGMHDWLHLSWLHLLDCPTFCNESHNITMSPSGPYAPLVGVRVHEPLYGCPSPSGYTVGKRGSAEACSLGSGAVWAVMSGLHPDGLLTAPALLATSRACWLHYTAVATMAGTGTFSSGFSLTPILSPSILPCHVEARMLRESRNPAGAAAKAEARKYEY